MAELESPAAISSVITLSRWVRWKAKQVAAHPRLCLWPCARAPFVTKATAGWRNVAQRKGTGDCWNDRAGCLDSSRSQASGKVISTRQELARSPAAELIASVSGLRSSLMPSASVPMLKSIGTFLRKTVIVSAGLPLGMLSLWPRSTRDREIPAAPAGSHLRSSAACGQFGQVRLRISLAAKVRFRDRPRGSVAPLLCASAAMWEAILSAGPWTRPKRGEYQPGSTPR
jgi:hypothetical protein